MGIRLRIAGSYLTVILAAVVILELFLIFAVRSYYLHNIGRTLQNQGELASSFYRQYFADQDLALQSDRLLSGFSQYSAAQVQIIDASCRLLKDSAGPAKLESMAEYPDAQAACDGHAHSWRGREPLTDEPVMAVSYPLQGDHGAVGVVRFVTSLTETYRTLRQISCILIAAGCAVVAFAAVLGSVLSRTITGPIKDLKWAAEKMGEGDFSIRVGKRYDDELGTLADTLNVMASKISRAERLKNEFISSVSHELRTPLTSIKGWAVTLNVAKEERDDALLQEGLAIIESESDRLALLVDELLDFSKWENEAVELRPAALLVPDLLGRVVKQVQPRADRQQIALSLHSQDPLPTIQADENRLKQVLLNLLDNALKFTPARGSIRVEAYREGEQIVIAVEDTGAGIPEQELASVFDLFYKGAHKAGGSGLGLTVSERIVKLHGGSMEIESAAGSGTVVRVRLPADMPNI